MAFEVTATKKRPQTFDELVGQEFVVSTLKQSMLSGRVAHAFLFAGPRGVGKTSAARILAKALNCDTGPTDNPCGVCSNCKEISTGNSLDVIEIDGASNTSVNDVREIRDEVLFAPNSCRYKVYIIDEVHMLSNSAFNALLKTIEEPPPYIVFIFATTEIHKVPPTIRSRCQQFNFRLLSIETIKVMLEQVCREMNIQSDQDALFWIAKESTGSLRDAYTLLDQIISFSGENISLEKIREKLGVLGLDTINALIERVVRGEAGNALEMIQDILASGVSVEQFIVDLTEYFRNILFIKLGIHKESIIGCPVERFSDIPINTYSCTQLERALGLLLSVYKSLKFSLNQRYELELLITQLSYLSEYIDPKELVQKVESLRSEIETQFKGNRGCEPEENEPAECWKQEKENENLDNTVKQQLLASIKKTKLALYSALEKALCWKLDGDTLILQFEDGYSAGVVRDEKPVLASKIEEILGKKIDITIEINNESERSDTNDVRHDTKVEMVKKVFKGEVIQ